ncbi:MAG TPA: hypothetical protein VFK45_08725 [Gammaproteobacteria bacterium]|nr:hypothetical protein [Gammaproteobacteria bacterium]
MPVGVTPEMVDMAMRVAALTLARLISEKKLDPSAIGSKEDLLPILRSLGTTREDAFEIHIEQVPKKLQSIRGCIANDDPESAVVLLYTAVEGEVNTAIRILLRIQGYSQSKITTSLQGTDFRSKIDLVLPLLGTRLSPRLRQVALESQAIRNLAVHFKAAPALWSDSESKAGDHDRIYKKAAEFLGRNPIDKFEDELVGLVGACLSHNTELRAAHDLLQRLKT